MTEQYIPISTTPFEDKLSYYRSLLEQKEKDPSVKYKISAWLKEVAIPLDKEIKRNGFLHVQVKRGNKAFIYAVCDPVTRNVLRHEIYLIRVNPPLVAFGKNFEPSEQFPGNEAFGTWAWVKSPGTPEQTFAAALEKFQTIESMADDREESDDLDLVDESNEPDGDEGA